MTDSDNESNAAVSDLIVENVGIHCPSGNGLFVLYYGFIQDPASNDLCTDENENSCLPRIMSKQPNFVVVGNGLQGRSDIPTYIHQNGGRAIQYVALGQGVHPPDEIDAIITQAMNAGYDGIFFDEVINAPYVYNSERTKHLKSYGKSKLAIFNPGVAPELVPLSMFNYADIVSVENAYNQAVPPSHSAIASWRWLAVQGHPANQAAPSAEEAKIRTTQFRSNGGFWYYSSPYLNDLSATHVKLPQWYEEFADWVKEQPGPECNQENVSMISDILFSVPMWVISHNAEGEVSSRKTVELPADKVGSKVTAHASLAAVDWVAPGKVKVYIEQVNTINGPILDPSLPPSEYRTTETYEGVRSITFRLWIKGVGHAWSQGLVFVHS